MTPCITSLPTTTCQLPLEVRLIEHPRLLVYSLAKCHRGNRLSTLCMYERDYRTTFLPLYA
jgi:hypothetical protein